MNIATAANQRCPPLDRSHWQQVHIRFKITTLTVQLNELLLEEIFGSFGSVADCTIKEYHVNVELGTVTGYAFVYYFTVEAAHAAIHAVNMHNGFLHELIHFRCNFAHDLKSTSQENTMLDGHNHKMLLRGGSASSQSVDPLDDYRLGSNSRSFYAPNANQILSGRSFASMSLESSSTKQDAAYFLQSSSLSSSEYDLRRSESLDRERQQYGMRNPYEQGRSPSAAMVHNMAHVGQYQAQRPASISNGLGPRIGGSQTPRSGPPTAISAGMYLYPSSQLAPGPSVMQSTADPAMGYSMMLQNSPTQPSEQQPMGFSGLPSVGAGDPNVYPASMLVMGRYPGPLGTSPLAGAQQPHFGNSPQQQPQHVLALHHLAPGQPPRYPGQPQQQPQQSGGYLSVQPQFVPRDPPSSGLSNGYYQINPPLPAPQPMYTTGSSPMLASQYPPQQQQPPQMRGYAKTGPF